MTRYRKEEKHALILNSLEEKPLSTADVSLSTGLTKAYVYNAMHDLLNEGKVEKIGSRKVPFKGTPSILWRRKRHD